MVGQTGGVRSMRQSGRVGQSSTTGPSTAVGASLNTCHHHRIELVSAGDHVLGERAQRLADLTETVRGKFATVLGGHEREHGFTEARVYLSEPCQQFTVAGDHRSPSSPLDGIALVLS